MPCVCCRADACKVYDCEKRFFVSLDINEVICDVPSYTYPFYRGEHTPERPKDAVCYNAEIPRRKYKEFASHLIRAEVIAPLPVTKGKEYLYGFLYVTVEREGVYLMKLRNTHLAMYDFTRNVIVALTPNERLWDELKTMASRLILKALERC